MKFVRFRGNWVNRVNRVQMVVGLIGFSKYLGSRRFGSRVSVLERKSPTEDGSWFWVQSP